MLDSARRNPIQEVSANHRKAADGENWVKKANTGPRFLRDIRPKDPTIAKLPRTTTNMGTTMKVFAYQSRSIADF